ncbi:class I SAM-dependent methyltransferase [Pantanalinema sp. GBBB05]|uniref:class I SAM-dependent methyltransferase n=1 Tax=Pantanalinema sp. GBBB05 TaxID=2604139 RepID=UPI001DB94428|nr:class I SAM-dependent methyltransferase [Pantanalinema sp. GBBB05]
MTDNLFAQKQWLFDRWAPSYDRLFPSVFYQAIHKRLLDYVSFPDRPQVLDLGCGTGRLLDRLATQYPDLFGIGCDLSPEMIHQARLAKRYAQLIFVQGNAEALPFADTQFNAIFNTISFLHYPNPAAVLAEVRRVLQSNGQFYLVDFTTSPWMGSYRYVNLPSHIRFYSPAGREQLGEQVGLRCLGHHYLLGPVLLTIFGID